MRRQHREIKARETLSPELTPIRKRELQVEKEREPEVDTKRILAERLKRQRAAGEVAFGNGGIEASRRLQRNALNYRVEGNRYLQQAEKLDREIRQKRQPESKKTEVARLKKLASEKHDKARKLEDDAKRIIREEQFRAIYR